MPILIIASLLGSNLKAYEAMHDKTPVGEIRILDLPERTALEARSDSSYFSENNGLFRKLFRYISANDVSMTTPVEADIDPGKMRFFVGSDDLGKDLANSDEVVIRKLAPRKVVSIGIRGGYSEKRYNQNLRLLEKWIDANKSVQVIGDPYGVYWNGPFVPAPLKRSEIHLPIRLYQEKPPNSSKSNKQRNNQ